MANTGNIQQIIDYGVTANDGTGDPLRTAFIKTDENFDNVWLAGPVGSNITIGNNTIQVNDTNGNLILKPNGVGIVETKGSILPDFDELRDLGSPSHRFRSIYFTGTLDTAGNLSVDNLTVNNDLSLDGNVIVSGNLTVNGTTLTVNIANLDIADKMIVIANGSPNAQSADGAGITIDGANAVMRYSAPFDVMVFNKGVTVFGNLSAEHVESSSSISAPLLSGSNITASVVNTGYIKSQFPIFIQSDESSWEFSGNILYTPESGSWQSSGSTEYISSGPNGFINLTSYYNGNLATELYMEHGFVRIRVDNGGPEQDWNFLVNGTLQTPGNIISPATISANNVSANKVNISSDLYVKTGTFTGDERGDNSIYAGYPTFTFLGTDVIAQFSGNVNQYTQFNFQNYNSGPRASGDYVITADNGTDTTHFLNIGLTGSGWDGSQDNSLGNILGPNDGYMYVQDGDLAIGVRNGDNSHVWKFDTAGGISGQGTFTAKTTITPPVALVNLSPEPGARAFVNDSNLVANSATFGSQISGGGSNTAPVWSDGTAWYIG